VPPYRSNDPQVPPGLPGSPPGDDRAYLWMALVVGLVPLVGAAVSRHWSDSELGAGTALVAVAAPALVRSYLKGD
jgi:hypothetical protein